MILEIKDMLCTSLTSRFVAFDEISKPDFTSMLKGGSITANKDFKRKELFNINIMTS